MVLAELGGKISRALQTMAASSIIDDEVVAKLTSTIAMALLQADVDINSSSRCRIILRQRAQWMTPVQGQTRERWCRVSVDQQRHSEDANESN